MKSSNDSLNNSFVLDSGGFITPLILVAVLIVLGGGAYWMYGGGKGTLNLLTKKQTDQNAPAQNTGPVTNPNLEVKEGVLLENFPTDIPTYPGAKLETSTKDKLSQDPNKGLNSVWVIEGQENDLSVPKVMKWYLTETQKQGWKVIITPPDPEEYGEQVAHIQKGDIVAMLHIEKESKDEVEIVIDIPIVFQNKK